MKTITYNPATHRLVPVELIDQFPEINPSNYDHDGVCELNRWGCQVVTSLQPEPAEVEAFGWFNPDQLEDPDALGVFVAFRESYKDNTPIFLTLPDSSACIAELETEFNGCSSMLDNAERRIEELEAEVAALKEDAERYRWLRAKYLSIDYLDGQRNANLIESFESSNSECLRLDSAIDAARKEK